MRRFLIVPAGVTHLAPLLDLGFYNGLPLGDGGHSFMVPILDGADPAFVARWERRWKLAAPGAKIERLGM